MKKRPFVGIFICLIAGVWLLRWLGLAWIWRSPAGSQPEETARKELFVYGEGTVYQQETKTFGEKTYTYLYLKQANLIIQSKKYPIRNLKCICREETEEVIGCGLLLQGRLVLPREADNPGGFDQRQYEQTRKIDFYLQEAQLVEIRKTDGHLVQGIWEMRKRGKEILEEIYPEETAGILEAMLLGDKSMVEGETKEQYQAAGISHIMAISGLHISLIGTAVWGIFLRIGFPPAVSAAGAVFLLLGYGALIGTPATAFRALVMFGIRLGGRIWGRAYDLPSALSAAGILLLWENPDLLADCGFQLSFLAVAGMGLTERTEGKKKSFQALNSGLTLWFVTLPVVLFHFYQVSVIGILVNLAVIPLLPAVLGSGFLSLVLGQWSVPFGKAAGLGADLVLRGYGWLGKWAGRFPAGMWTPGQPKEAEIVFYYVLLLIFRYLLYERKGRGKSRIAAAAVLLLLMASPWEQKVQITMLDVGQGDGIVLQDGRASLLVDGGSSSERQVGKYVLLPYLKQQGISRLEGILLTHPDADHINGAREVLEEGKKGWLSVERLFLPWWMQETPEGKELVRMAEEQKTVCYFLKRGDRIRWGEGELHILHPDQKEGKMWEPNAGSLVFLWTWRDHKALFTGDLPMEEERWILEQEVSSCEILKVAHHGSDGSTSEEFLERIAPRIALLSCGEKNRYGHPGEALMQRLEQAECRIFRTDLEGAVTCRWK